MEVRKKKDWDKKKKTLSGILSPVRQIPSMIKHWGTKRIRAVRFHLGKRQPWRTKKASAAKAEVFIERREVAAAVIETTAKKPKIKKDKWFYSVVSGSCAVFIAGVCCLLFGAWTPQVHTVTINDMGRKTVAKTEETTVEDFLKTAGVTLDDEDIVETSLGDTIDEDMEIVIHRAMPLTVVSGDQQIEVKMIAGTVEEALERAGIEPAEDDEVYPSEDSFVQYGMTINHIEVEVKYETEQETLEYREVTKESDKVEKGKELLMQKGEEGLQESKIKIVYKNGKEVERTVVSETVVKEPVDKIIYIGTYEEPVTVAKEESSSSGGSSSNKNSSSGSKKEESSSGKVDSDGDRTTVPTTAEIHGSSSLYEHKKAAPPSSEIIAKTVVINHVTAYTHTGNRTATGTWPKIGTIAADPKRFPYGTKVYVPGYGYGRIEDTGGFRNESRTVFDLFMETEKECREWGRKYDLKVYILK